MLIALYLIRIPVSPTDIRNLPKLAKHFGPFSHFLPIIRFWTIEKRFAPTYHPKGRSLSKPGFVA